MFLLDEGSAVGAVFTLVYVGYQIPHLMRVSPWRSRLDYALGLIAALGLESRVRLLGTTPHEEMGGLLAAADVMALASESEGLANAWVEALASGTRPSSGNSAMPRPSTNSPA